MEPSCLSIIALQIMVLIKLLLQDKNNMWLTSWMRNVTNPNAAGAYNRKKEGERGHGSRTEVKNLTFYIVNTYQKM